MRYNIRHMMLKEIEGCFALAQDSMPISQQEAPKIQAEEQEAVTQEELGFGTAIEENDELVSTVTPLIEVVSLQPTAQPPPQTAPKGPNPGRRPVHHTDPPKVYPPCPTWESRRVP